MLFLHDLLASALKGSDKKRVSGFAPLTSFAIAQDFKSPQPLAEIPHAAISNINNNIKGEKSWQ